MVGILTPKIDGFPRVFGVGYDTITQALFGELALQMTVVLLFAKILATILTLGSGGSGGIFAPSLFMGAMLGEAFGQVVHAIFPAITAPVGAYALVGMAAVFSGAAHAPITAILILFEMTGDYHIILPLMLTTVMSTLVSRLISRESIYTLKLTRRGVHLQQGQDIDVMQSVTVRDAMTTDVDTVPLSMSLDELADEFSRSHHHGFPVVDGAGELAGVVSIQDLERAKAAGPIDGRTVADITTREGLLVAYPYEPMWKALRRLGRRDVGRLPVVEEEGSRRLVGAVRRSDIIRAYDQAIAARAHHQHRAEVLRLGQVDGTSFLHLRIPSDSLRRWAADQRARTAGRVPDHLGPAGAQATHGPRLHDAGEWRSGDRLCRQRLCTGSAAALDRQLGRRCTRQGVGSGPPCKSLGALFVEIRQQDTRDLAKRLAMSVPLASDPLWKYNAGRQEIAGFCVVSTFMKVPTPMLWSAAIRNLSRALCSIALNSRRSTSTSPRPPGGQ